MIMNAVTIAFQNNIILYYAATIIKSTPELGNIFVAIYHRTPIQYYVEEIQFCLEGNQTQSFTCFPQFMHKFRNRKNLPCKRKHSSSFFFFFSVFSFQFILLAMCQNDMLRISQVQLFLWFMKHCILIMCSGMLC